MIRLGALGDVVRTLPAVSMLRRGWPGAHVAWLVEASAAGALDGQPWVDEVIVFPREALVAALRAGRPLAAARRLARFLRELRARRFELVIDFHSILKSGLLSFASGARVRAGYAPPFGREGSHRFATLRARLAPAKASRFDRNRALVRFLGVQAAPDARPFRVDPAARRTMDVALGGDVAPVVLHPGSSPGTPYKRWAPERYGELASALQKECGVECVVTRGRGDEELRLARAVVDASSGAARLAPETRSLQELAALLASARLYVGGDTGPMHVASLVGTPVVQILGPTDPVENAPWSETPSRSVRVPVPCSPCRRGCEAVTCLRVVPPALVLAAARELLGA